MTRPSGRAADELRRVSFERRHAKHADGASDNTSAAALRWLGE